MNRAAPILAMLLGFLPARAAELPSSVFAASPARGLPRQIFADWAWDNLPRTVFATLPRPASLPDALFAYALEDELQDVLLLSESRPVMIRLHVFVDDRGFKLPWGEFVAKVHRYIDRNDDGTVTVKEGQTGNWQQLLLVGLFRGGMGAGTPTVKLDADGDGKVSVMELSNYLRPNFGPFQVQVNAGADSRAEALFTHLDKNKDRKLSQDEIAAAPLTLLPFDLDEDESYTISEMGPFQSRFAAQQRRFNNGNPGQGNVPSLVALNPGEPKTTAANNLITKYDKGSGPGNSTKDRKLDRFELGIATAMFDSADANRDGLLDVTEIAKLLDRLSPDLEFTVHVERETGRGTIDPTSVSGSTAPLAAKARKIRAELLDIDLDVTKAAIQVSENPPQRGFNARDFFIQNFKGSDNDGNGYLDKKEVQNGFLNQIFPVADRDGDEKFTEQELYRYLDMTEEAGKCRTILSISDLGRALFNHLDENHDRRLGAREIRSAWQTLQKDDRDHDGKIAVKEIPRHLQLSFGRAQTGPQFGFDGGDDDDVVAKSETSGAAPLWFLQMDRNRDGDVSAREFLGTAAAFSRIDLDHDGLISAEEASKVK
jgi:Ca2+-binding EF-hand superfamily protein